MSGIWILFFGMAVGAPRPVAPEEIGRRHGGEQVVVEDKILSVLGAGENRQFRLRRCAGVSFRLGGGGPRNLADNVRVVGTVGTDAGQVYVEVESVELLPSDPDQYASLARQIEKDDFLGWYSLADWARERARLYMDDTMRDRSVEAYRRGVGVERRVAGSDPEKLRQLESRLRDQGYLNDVDFGELSHAILRAEYKSSIGPEAGAKTLELFADRVVAVLDPDRKGLPAAIDGTKRTQYDRDPLGFFRQSAELQRRSLVRYWESTLRKQAWEARLVAGEVDGYQAWEWSMEQLADYPEHGRLWLESAVAMDVNRLADLNSLEVAELAHRVRVGLGDETRADALSRRWLEARERSMRESEDRASVRAKRQGARPRPKDAKSRYELAQLWRHWFAGDATALDQAKRLLLESLEIEPQFELAADALREMRFVRDRDGRWLSPEAIRAGEGRDTGKTVSAGMAMERVLETLGEPESQSRFVTGAKLVEHHWTYRAIGETVHIILVTRGGEPGFVRSVHRRAAADR